MKNQNNQNQNQNTDPQSQSPIPNHLFGYELGRAIAMTAAYRAEQVSIVADPICQSLVKDRLSFFAGLNKKDTPDLIGGKPGQISENQIGEMLGLMKALNRIGKALDGANSLYGANEIHGQFKLRRSEMSEDQKNKLPRLMSAFGELVKFAEEYATRPNVENGNVIWRRLKPGVDTVNNPLRDVALPRTGGSSSRSRSKAKKPVNPYMVDDTVILSEDYLGENLVNNLADLGYDLDLPVTVVWTNGDSIGFTQDGVETETAESRVLRKEQKKRGQKLTAKVMKLRVGSCKATSVSRKA